MPKYRQALPLLDTELAFATDSGLETTLVFHDGIDLPCFASFPLLDSEAGRDRLLAYFRRHLDIAAHYDMGAILESVTWRANPDWGRKLGYDGDRLDVANREAIALLEPLRDAYERPGRPVVISGNLGPRGDGYRSDAAMQSEAARAYHSRQIEVFADTAADMVSAFTMNDVGEALGVALSARDAAMPVVLSFTVETDGRLPSGVSLRDAIREVDDASAGYPAYYMINCAHPTHFEHVLGTLDDTRARIRGLRANASMRSHAELDESTELDDGDPVALGAAYAALLDQLPNLRVFGGCCGTDHRHVARVCEAVAPRLRPRATQS